MFGFMGIYMGIPIALPSPLRVAYLKSSYQKYKSINKVRVRDLRSRTLMAFIEGRYGWGP